MRPGRGYGGFFFHLVSLSSITAQPSIMINILILLSDETIGHESRTGKRVCAISLKNVFGDDTSVRPRVRYIGRPRWRLPACARAGRTVYYNYVAMAGGKKDL